MNHEMTNDNVQKMLEVGDRKNKGYVDIKDFMWLMEEIGLIKHEKETDHDMVACQQTTESDLEKEYRKARAFKQR